MDGGHVSPLATVLGCLSLFLFQALCACISVCVVCVCTPMHGLHVTPGACLSVCDVCVNGNGFHNNTNNVSLTRQVTFCFGCGDCLHLIL